MSIVLDPRDSEVVDCLDCAELYEATDGHECSGAALEQVAA
jgi:hypothetical protein